MRIIFFFFLFELVVKSIYGQTPDCIIENYETSIVIGSNHNLKETVSIEITINNRKGEYISSIEIPYSKKNKIQSLDARIEDSEGNTVRKLKPNEITDKSSISNISLFEDDYVKSFDLKHNVYPYKIFYNYTIIYQDFIGIADWNPIVDYEAPTNNAVLNLSTPKDYKINIYTDKIENKKIDTLENSIVYNFISDYKKILKHEIYSTPVYEKVPSVIINPLKFDYGVTGKFYSWQSFGNWVYDLNLGLNDLTFTEKQKINELVNDAKSNKDKIEILYKYLQSNTRYVNVSIDIGGFQPYPASYVCTNRYGDCKALTNYMKAMLEYVGIHSNYTLVYAGDNPIKTEEKKLINRFNHIILFVPLEDDTIWLECTSNTNPAGYLGTFTQNRFALVTDRDKGQLIKTPELSINDVEEKRYYTIIPGKDASAEIHMCSILKGDEFENVSYMNISFTKKDIEKYIHRIIPINEYQLIQWNIVETNTKDSSIQLDIDFKAINYYKTYSDFIYTNLMSLKIPNFEKPGKRMSDLRINFPMNYNDTYTFHSYPGYSYNLLNDTSIESPYGKYTLKTELNENKLIVNRILIIYSGEYSLTEYSDFYKFIQNIKSEEQKNSVVLNINQ